MASVGISNRIILFFAGLVFARFAVWSGGELHGEVLGAIFGIIAAIIGGVLFSVFVTFATGGIFDSVEITVALATTFFLMFVFGVVVAPIGNIEGVAAWVTPWDWVLILGILPMILFAIGIICDLTCPER